MKATMKPGVSLAVGLGLAAALLQPALGFAHEGDDGRSVKARAQFAQVTQATAPFHDVHTALAVGYTPFADQDGIYCIDHPEKGAMGIHYVNGALVGDGSVDPLRPEALIYEPYGNGKVRLVGMEYIVFQAAWHADPGHLQPPELFGHRFHATPAGNRYGIPAFYALHVWLWQHNPDGLLEDWNPSVACR